MSAEAEAVLLVAAALLLVRPVAGCLARLMAWFEEGSQPERPVATGSEGMLYRHGIARSDLMPRGKVFVRGELWNAVTNEPVAAGGVVEVVAVDGLTLRVRPRAPVAELGCGGG